MNLITVKTYDSLIDAHMGRAKLDSEEITCYLFDDNIVGLDPLYSYAVGGIKLKVNEADVAKVHEIFNEVSEQPSTTDANEIISCPNCGSEDLFSDFKSVKSVGGVLSILFSFASLVYPIFNKTVFKCKACDCEFKKEETEIE